MINLDNIKLRAWQFKDIDSLVENANNKNIWDNLRDEFPYPYTKEAAKEWIEVASIFNPLTNFAIDYEGLAIGGIGIEVQSDIFKNNAEIGYWVGEKYWNMGVATKAIEAIQLYAFKNFSINRLYANVFVSNHASIKALAKCGFLQEALLQKAIIKNGKLQDYYIYSITKPNIHKL